MGIINIVNLRSVDLNLLVVFHVLMQERHVTRAAVTLHLTQGAVSAALGRLRSLFDDPLFVRNQGEMVPTRKAQELAGPISQALGRLDTLLDSGPDFDPRESERTFHLAMPDDIESIIAPRLIQESVSSGWRVKFSFHQSNAAIWHNRLEDPAMDLAVGPMPTHLPGELRHRQIMSGSYLCLYSRKQFDFPEGLTKQDYLSVGHIRVSFSTQRGFIDDLLEAEGLTRSVPVSLSHFAGILPVLHRAPVIATIPDFAAHAYVAVAEDLVVSSAPLTVPTFAVSTVWRVTAEDDPAHQWLRDTIANLSTDLLPDQASFD